MLYHVSHSHSLSLSYCPVSTVLRISKTVSLRGLSRILRLLPNFSVTSTVTFLLTLPTFSFVSLEVPSKTECGLLFVSVTPDVIVFTSFGYVTTRYNLYFQTDANVYLVCQFHSIFYSSLPTRHLQIGHWTVER